MYTNHYHHHYTLFSLSCKENPYCSLGKNIYLNRSEMFKFCAQKFLKGDTMRHVLNWTRAVAIAPRQTLDCV